jgi:hypothetical protein
MLRFMFELAVNESAVMRELRLRMPLTMYDSPLPQTHSSAFSG